TISEIAHGLLSSSAVGTALGIVPVGTGNDMAGTVGIRNYWDAIRALTQGRTRMIDVIAVHCLAENGTTLRHVLLFAGVGLVTEVLRKTTRVTKQFLGQRLAYRVGLLRALCRYRLPRMQVTCDGTVFEDFCLFAGASNAVLAGGGMKIAPGACLDDGLLNV